MDQISPEYAARYFKYLQQFKCSYIVNKLELRRIQAKSFYNQYKKYFDAITNTFNRYQIDTIEYIKFFVNEYNKTERDITSSLTDMKTINAFIDYLKYENKKEKIYRLFVKSANAIADDCVQLDILTAKDYIRELIASKKLANYYFAGKISKYWFSAIPSFKKIIEKLDQMSKDEFNDIYERFDIYNSEINEAFLKMKNCKVNPIKFTDDLIFKKRNEIGKK